MAFFFRGNYLYLCPMVGRGRVKTIRLTPENRPRLGNFEPGMLDKTLRALYNKSKTFAAATSLKGETARG